MSKALVISAFPACGKSWMYKNRKDRLNMLDSDSSKFSWILDKDGNSTGERNPDFPANYIAHIKENLDKVDVIFVSSHLIVRQALTDASIDFITIYPDKYNCEKWVGRCYLRGNDDSFIKFIYDNWSNFMNDVVNEPTGLFLFSLGNGPSDDNIDGLLRTIWINRYSHEFCHVKHYAPLMNVMTKLFE